MNFDSFPMPPELEWQVIGDSISVLTWNVAAMEWTKNGVRIDVPPATFTIQDPEVLTSRWVVTATTFPEQRGRYPRRATATATLDIAAANYPVTADTGQTSCFDDAAMLPCESAKLSHAGQDAHFDKGPLNRFSAGNGWVRDASTGLDWQDPISEDATCRAPWRLPTYQELNTLIVVDDNLTEELPTAFQARDSTLYFFQDRGDTKLANLSQQRWCQPEGDKPAALRCVRGGQTWVPNTVAYRSESIIIDYSTGLWWMAKPDESKRTWKQALAYCAKVSVDGHNDWRLPDRNELQSFGGKSWSSTTLPCNPAMAFASYGTPATKTIEGHPALCVRKLRKL